MATYDLGKVVGSDGTNGTDGSTVWNTSTAPTYANSKYTFNISNLSGKTGLQIAVNDIIFYSTYYYIVSTVNSTTVDCSTRVNIKGSDATVTIATSWEQTLSDSKVPSEKLVKNTIDTKADSSDIPTKTSDLTNDGADGTNVFVANNDSRLSDARTPTSHTHGQVTNDGKISSTAVTVATGDNIVITDYSDSSKIKRVANILADHVKDSTAHSNIGSSANDTQATINTDINTALGNKVSKSSTTGLLKNDGSVDTNTYLTSSAISGMLTTSDIANNLTTTTTGKVLDASQGKALADLIGQAIAYINQ